MDLGRVAPCTLPRYPTAVFTKAVSIIINQMRLGTLPGAEANWHRTAYIYANKLPHPPKQGCCTQAARAALAMPGHCPGSTLAATGQAWAEDQSRCFTRIDTWGNTGHT